MKRLEREGFKYKDYCLGDMVHFKGTQAKIIGFDLGDNVNNFIALEVSDELQNKHYSNKKNIKDSNVDYLVYLESPKDYFVWTYAKDIVKVSSNNIPSKVKSPFKVGQRVWDCSRGYGAVIRIIDDEDAEYPVVVLFDDKLDNNDTMYFTLDGRQYKRYNRTLFFEEILIPESALKPKRWRAKKNECYFAVNTWGEIDVACEDNVEVDNKRYKIGNYFRTKEEAEDSIIYKAFQELKE